MAVQSVFWKLDDCNCLDPGELCAWTLQQGLPLDFWQRANSYACPLGTLPGRAWILLDREDLNGLDREALHNLTVTVDQVETTFKSLLIVKATNMSAGIDDDPQAAYLVEMVDVRHVLSMSTIGAQYNVACPAPPDDGTLPSHHYVETLNAGAMWTWQTMLGNIWSYLPAGLAGAAPTLPYSPHYVPDSFRFLGVSAWEALRLVLSKIGCALRYDPLAGTFSIIRLGETQAGLSSTEQSLNKLYDYEPLESDAARLPETIRVFFPKIDKHHGTERDTPRTGNWSQPPYHPVDVATGVSGAKGGTVVALWDDLYAVYNFDATLDNTAGVNARAAEVAANYVSRIRASQARMRRRYSGALTSILPGSEIKVVIWRDYADEQGMCTETIRSPSLPMEMVRDDQRPIDFVWGTDFGGSISSAAENLAPPDLARRTHPIYPRLPQLVTITGEGSDGDDVSPTEGLFSGKVTRTDPEADLSSNAPYEQNENCWVVVVDNPGGSADGTTLKQGDRYIGRLNGTAFVSSDGRPLYLVRKGAGAAVEIVRFRLYENLAEGGSALATLRTWNGAAWVDGDQITVYDAYPGIAAGVRVAWRGFVGNSGYAIQLGDFTGDNPAKYEIIYLAQKARFIAGTLDDTELTDSGTATVTNYWFGFDPAGEDGSVAIRTTGGIWNGLVAGDKIVAAWDEDDDVFEVLTAKQQASQQLQPIVWNGPLSGMTAEAGAYFIFEGAHYEQGFYDSPGFIIPGGAISPTQSVIKLTDPGIWRVTLQWELSDETSWTPIDLFDVTNTSNTTAGGDSHHHTYDKFTGGNPTYFVIGSLTIYLDDDNPLPTFYKITGPPIGGLRNYVSYFTRDFVLQNFAEFYITTDGPLCLQVIGGIGGSLPDGMEPEASANMTVTLLKMHDISGQVH